MAKFGSIGQKSQIIAPGVIKIMVRANESPVDSGHLVFKVRAAGNESL